MVRGLRFLRSEEGFERLLGRGEAVGEHRLEMVTGDGETTPPVQVLDRNA